MRASHGGQIAIDVDEKLLCEGDYETQGCHTVKNTYAVIAASGASPKDVLRAMVHVVDPTQENLEALYTGSETLPASSRSALDS